MKKSDKGFLQHLGAGILAGLLFYLVVGAVFSVKMCIINEATHQLHFAYPFTLNFIAAYLLVGAIFGCTFGLLGGFLLNRPAAEKG